jgi:hydroxylamine reductase (hybrid-cluster protein)
MAKKMRTPEEASIDPATREMLQRAEELGIETAFSRADAMPPCKIGADGMCCKNCGMGPCRLVKDGQVGVCGATIDTIQARNFLRAVTVGTSAHSDHGRDMAFTLKAVANEETDGYVIRDVAKLRTVARYYNIPVEDRSPNQIANDLADLYIAQFGQQTGQVAPIVRAPKKRQEIWAASQHPEIIAYAKEAGAQGVNLSGICCTANEILMRQGIPAAGNFLQQELAILTGSVEAMVVDVQCIMQALVGLAENFHTKIITTSPKVKITGATHIEFEEEHALTIAKNILKEAIDNYKNRGEVQIPEYKSELIPGFSHEYINYTLGGSYRSSFRPLNDAIISGRIRGVAAVVGCNNPRSQHDYLHTVVTKELLKHDVLVVETGCSAIASAKEGLLMGQAGLDQVGPGLREICETTGLPPVLHMGSCVDNTRILTVLTQVVEEGGLGDDIDQVPAVGLAPEWMSEKALAIGTYCVASGVYVIFGGSSPVSGMPDKMADSTVVSNIMIEGWEEKFGGKLEFIPDPDEMIKATLDHIDKKRAELGLVKYDPSLFGNSGDNDMLELEKLPLKERRQAIYGSAK